METAGIEDQRDGRVCVRPSIRVELSATPMTVYIGREIAGDPCRDAAALEHELKHVAVYEDELAQIADDVRAAARSRRTTTGFCTTAAGPKRSAKRKAALGAEIGPLLADDARRIKERQRAIDTPEEYARVVRRVRRDDQVTVASAKPDQAPELERIDRMAAAGSA